MNQQTDFLVPASSFLIGIGSLLSLSGPYFEYNNSSTPDQADQRAIGNDWAMVGQDIRHAMISVNKGDGNAPNPGANGEK